MFSVVKVEMLEIKKWIFYCLLLHINCSSFAMSSASLIGSDNFYEHLKKLFKLPNVFIKDRQKFCLVNMLVESPLK